MDAQDGQVVERAYQAWDEGDWAAAGPLLEQAARAAEGPFAGSLWFDAALAYKFLRDWPRALELGKTAADYVARGEQEPAFWNLGIAATVLHEWDVARDAWQGYGIKLESTEGEVAEDFGFTPVRIDPQGSAEVVWAQRICPTRAVIRSVPMYADRRFGDVIVHDGAPNGTRILDGRQFPVFDEICVWESSGVQTWTACVDADAEAVQDLLELFARNQFGAEPTTGVNMICAGCSTGDVEQHHHVPADGDGQRFLLAAPEERLFALLDEWRGRDTAGRSYSDVALLVVGDAAERTAE